MIQESIRQIIFFSYCQSETLCSYAFVCDKNSSSVAGLIRDIFPYRQPATVCFVKIIIVFMELAILNFATMGTFDERQQYPMIQSLKLQDSWFACYFMAAIFVEFGERDFCLQLKFEPTGGIFLFPFTHWDMVAI